MWFMSGIGAHLTASLLFSPPQADGNELKRTLTYPPDIGVPVCGYHVTTISKKWMKTQTHDRYLEQSQ